MNAFSPRQIEVIKAIASGLSRKQAADKIGMKQGTVNSHMERIGRKLSLCGGPADLSIACTHFALAFGLIENAYRKD